MEIKHDISLAMRKLHRHTRRAEQEKFDAEFFVDNHQVDLLESPDWQIIYGRRGSGKTTLLQALACRVDDLESSSYCIYIDTKQITPSPTVLSDQYDFSLAVEYFYTFMYHLSRKIFLEYTEESVNNPLKKFTRRISGNRSLVESVVEEIGSLSESPPTRPRPRYGKSCHSQEQNVLLNGEGSVSAAPNDKDIRASAGFSTGGSRNKKNSQEVEYVYEVSQRYQRICRKLGELLDLINVDRFYILIDEWANISRLNDDNVQVYFAELLRTTLSHIKKVTVKVASIKGSTKLNLWSESGGIGLEIDADIFEAVDLDNVYLNNDDNRVFFKELLFKKLCRVHPPIRKYGVASNQNNYGGYIAPEGYLHFIFKKDSGIDDVIKASGNIPREFISVVCHCAHQFDFNIGRPWRTGQVRKHIKSYSIEKRREILRYNDRTSAIFKRILERISDSRSRAFSVSSEDYNYFERNIQELYYARLIHPVSMSRIPQVLRYDYVFFYIDFGYFIDAVSGVNDGKIYNDDNFIDSDITEVNLEKYLVEFNILKDYFITCAECGFTFDKSEKSYLTRQLCPECFLPALGS